MTRLFEGTREGRNRSNRLGLEYIHEGHGLSDLPRNEEGTKVRTHWKVASNNLRIDNLTSKT